MRSIIGSNVKIKEAIKCKIRKQSHMQSDMKLSNGEKRLKYEDINKIEVTNL